MNRFKTVSLLTAALAIGVSAQAATVTYGSAFNIDFDALDGDGDATVLNTFVTDRNGGVSAPGTVSIVEAVSYGDATGTPNINGVLFTEVGGSTDFWGNTGIDGSVDSLLSGHATFNTLTLTGLTIGNTYQIQLIGIHDSRGGINEREYEVSYGGSDFTSLGAAPVLTRGAYGNVNGELSDNGGPYGTVVGTFVADATTQTIEIRSNQQDGNLGDDPDPGLSGYVLIDGGVPEPGSLALLGLGGLLVARRRR